MGVGARLFQNFNFFFFPFFAKFLISCPLCIGCKDFFFSFSFLLKVTALAGGEPVIFWFSLILSHKQRLRPLGNCAHNLLHRLSVQQPDLNHWGNLAEIVRYFVGAAKHTRSQSFPHLRLAGSILCSVSRRTFLSSLLVVRYLSYLIPPDLPV